uniref:Putative secreted protein n=1 Tax=Anopheles darlingi TaxID=43151 RepID=A0A2M4D5U7_ANODA
MQPARLYVTSLSLSPVLSASAAKPLGHNNIIIKQLTFLRPRCQGFPSFLQQFFFVDFPGSFSPTFFVFHFDFRPALKEIWKKRSFSFVVPVLSMCQKHYDDADADDHPFGPFGKDNTFSTFRVRSEKRREIS